MRRKRGGYSEGMNSKSKLVLVILTMTGLSFFGIDRMYAGQIGMGIGKFLTMGGFGIWALVDSILVLLNALTRSTEGLFGISAWSDDPDFVFKCTLAILLLPIFVTVISALTAGVTSKFISTNDMSPPAEEAAQPETDVDETNEETGKESFFV